MLDSSETFQNRARIITRRMFVLLSDRIRLREWKIAPQRGTIEDFFG